MKVALLLICCWAIAFPTEARTVHTFDITKLELLDGPQDNFHLPLVEGLLQELRKLLDYITQIALDSVHELKQSVDKLLEEVSQKSEELLQLANGSINDYLEEAKQNLTTVGSQVAECVVPATAKLEKVAIHSYENTKKCYDDLVTRVRLTIDNVEEHVDYVIKKVAEIEHIAVECMTQNPKLVDQVKCVLDHVNESTEIVQDIIKDVGKLTSETSREIVSLGNDTRDCLLDVVRMSRNEVDKVLSEVFECLKDQNSAFEQQSD
ncbi:uncharacterized protein LOC134213287 [Armigeres subalbatus]|uniref:uncharacterized protein LOC134213287 n=1 Tax=Armigeres subalbatus TaxID=124917 RepID=UPI002ED0CA44